MQFTVTTSGDAEGLTATEIHTLLTQDLDWDATDVTVRYIDNDEDMVHLPVSDGVIIYKAGDVLDFKRTDVLVGTRVRVHGCVVGGFIVAGEIKAINTVHLVVWNDRDNALILWSDVEYIETAS